MKCNLKISLPIYKIVYSLAYMFLFVLIRPTTSVYEIMAVIEPNVCFLAIVLVSDVYYCEFRSNRIHTFYLLPNQFKYRAIVQRFLITVMYLVLLVILFFWVFMIFQGTGSHLFTRKILLAYISTIVCCVMTILFFSALSFTVVNSFQNLWIGLGISAIVWFVFNMKIKEHIPMVLNIFAYKQVAGIRPYYTSRGIYAVIGVGLIALSYIAVLYAPRRKVKRYDKH